RLEDRLLLGQQPRQRPVEILERRLPPALGSYIVPRFMREALDVVRQVAGELDDRVRDAGFRLHARLDEALVDEVDEQRRRYFLEAHHRTGLVEGAPRTNHLFHQARFRAGEDVANLTLQLRGGAKRMFDTPAIEAVDRLELVERDHDRALALSGEF